MRNISIMLAAASLLALVGPARAADTFRLCTGGAEGNYFQAGHWVRRASSQVNVDVQTTAGSLENLDRLVAHPVEYDSVPRAFAYAKPEIAKIGRPAQ